MIEIIGPKDTDFDFTGKHRFNVTSHSTTITKQLSPFFLGPCKLYGNYYSKTVENAWQYAKVYRQYATDGEPNLDYFKWASKGWSSSYAVRYPMGKKARPMYSYWAGEKLGYIEARKRIYIPLYSEAARKTEAFAYLKELVDSGEDIVLWDFDGRVTSQTMEEVINDPTASLGHAFVIKMMLLEIL